MICERTRAGRAGIEIEVQELTDLIVAQSIDIFRIRGGFSGERTMARGIQQRCL
jgi:hypothetical protein